MSLGSSLLPFSELSPHLWIFWDEGIFAQYPRSGWTATLYIQCHAGVFYSFTNLKAIIIIIIIFNSS